MTRGGLDGPYQSVALSRGQSDHLPYSTLHLTRQESGRS